MSDYWKKKLEELNQSTAKPSSTKPSSAKTSSKKPSSNNYWGNKMDELNAANEKKKRDENLAPVIRSDAETAKTILGANSRRTANRDSYDSGVRGSYASRRYREQATQKSSLQSQLDDIDSQIKVKNQQAIANGRPKARNPQVQRELSDLYKQKNALKEQMKKLEENAPVYDKATAKKYEKGIENAQAALTEKYGEAFQDDMQKKQEAINKMATDLKTLEEEYTANPNATTKKRYTDTYAVLQATVTKYNEDYGKYHEAVDDYAAYMGIAKSDAGFWEIAKDSALAGMAQFNKGVTSTLALPDKLIEAITGSEFQSPLSDLEDYYAKNYETLEKKRQESVYGKRDVAKVLSELGVGTVAAIPNAALAVASAGSSVPAQLGVTSTGVSGAVSTAMSNMAKNPTYWSSVLQTLGTDYDKAIAGGASGGQAIASAILSSGLNAAIETSGGIETFPSRMDNGNLFYQLGKSALEEGIEEPVQGVVSGVTEKAIYDEDKPLWSTTDENAIVNPGRMAKEFGMGMGVGLILSGGQVGASVAGNAIAEHQNTKLNEIEQAVVDKEYENRLEQAGDISAKDKKEIYNDVVRDMERGYISTDTIEEVLGGETYKTYQDTVKNEDALREEFNTLNQMKQGEMTGEQLDRRNDLKAQLAEIQQTSQRDQLKSQLSDEVFNLAKTSRLSETYNEQARRGQTYNADLTKYDAKQQETVQRAIDSGILNNTNRTHEFVDMIAKISADKGVPFDFTDNAKLKDSGFALDGKTVNGYVNENGVTLNIDSAKALNAVVGHEITHVLEGTEFYDALSQTVIEYAKSKGDYQGRYDSLAKLYEGVENANIDAELTADLVGDYLFTDADFVKGLSVEHRNVFQKIYDEIKYLLKVATAGSKEARELEKVKRAFEDAYKATKNTAEDSGVKYSMSDIEIARDYIDYSDFESVNAKVDEKVADLVSRGKTVPLSAESVSSYEANADWTDKGAVRQLLKDVLEPHLGVSVQFEHNGQSATAYLTRNGINHSAGGPASPRKAAAFEMFAALVKNSEYSHSSENDSHSQSNQKIDGKIDWDTFVAVGTINGEPYPVVFKIRTIDSDIRSQIYEMATKNETGFAHKDGTQENPTDAHSNYGTSPISDGTLSQEGPVVKRFPSDNDYSLSEEGEAPVRRSDFDVYGEDIRAQKPGQENATVAENATVDEMFPDDFAPVDNDAERLDSLTDADVPSEVEATPAEITPVTADDPFANRNIEEVGNRKVKAFMYENPDVQPFFQAEAQVMLNELKNSTKGERWYNDQVYYETGGENGWGGTKRYTSDEIAYLLDNYKYTYEQIENGLNAIIEGGGKENNAVSKRIEFLLNDRLLNGYTDFTYGTENPPNQDYIALMNGMQTTEHNAETFDSLVADANVPTEELAPVPSAIPETVEDVAPVPENTETEQAEQLARIRRADPKAKEGSWWSRTKQKINNAVSALGDKGWVFENLSKKTGNREVEAKYDFMKNRSKGVAQEYINDNLMPIYEKVQELSKRNRNTAPVVEVNGDTVTDYTEQLEYYARHLLNVDRMSLETEAERTRRAEIRKQLEGYTEKQIQSIASETITRNTPQDRVAQIYLAQEYVDLGGEKGKNKPVFGSSVTAETSRKKVAEYEALHPEFAELEEAILNYNKSLLQIPVDQGLLKQRVADKWAKMYPHYVPIRRTDREGASVNVPLDSNKTGVNNPFKRAKGGNGDFLPLFDTMAMNTEQIFRAVHRNDFGKELMGALETSAAMDAEKSVDSATRQAVIAGELPAGTKVKAHDRDNIGTVLAFNAKTGKYKVHFENQQGYSATVNLDANLLSPVGNWKANNGKDADAADILESVDENDNAVLTPGVNGQNPQFTVFVNGKRVSFDITEDMYKAMQPAEGILADTYAVPNKLASGYKSVLTQLDPFFALFRNPVKDTKDVLFNSQHAFKTYITAPQTMKEIATKGKYFTEYIKNGGKTTSYYDTKKQAFVKKDGAVKKVVGFPWRAYNKATENVEMFWRLSEYIASRKAGRSIEVSMLDAARVTTNFGAGGDITKWANRNGAMFLNPSVQGVMQIGRNVREAYHGGLKGSAILAAKVLATGMSGLFFNWLLWDDDEDYEELSDYVKQNYFIVWKTDDGKFVRIPKGRMEAVIQNGFEQMKNLITGDDDVDMAAFANLVANNIAPNNPMEDNMIAPIKQALTNKTWYGGEIVPSRLQDLPAAEQFDETTDSVSKWIGEKTNTSPYKWNYAMKQFGGGFADAVLPMLTNEAEGGSAIAPIVDQFVSDSTFKNQNISDFYDKKNELKVNANASEATDDDILMSKYMNAVNDEISELYTQQREIQNSDKSDAEKREAVRNIQNQIIETAKSALDTYEDIHYDGDFAAIGDVIYQWYTPEEGDAYWRKLTENQVTKYKVTSAAGDAHYATDGNVHYRLNEGGDWRNISDWTKISDKQLERQNAVTKELGITPEEYWSKTDISFMPMSDGEYEYAYDNPENYAVAKAVGGYESYRGYSKDLYNIKADKDENGKSISGSRKEKVSEYINNLDADYYTKIILWKSEYPSDDSNNYEIIDYLNGRDDISYEEMVTILRELDFTVDEEGYISW